MGKKLENPENPKMKVAILLLRGIEGCGLTRYVVEEQQWYRENGIHCDIYAGNDKKWGRRTAQENEIREFSNGEISELSKRINNEYDIVWFSSLPAKKGHSEEYQDLCFDWFVKGIEKPIKLSTQNDHKPQSLARNFKIWETMGYMDACYTHSLSSPFAKKMKTENPSVPLLKMGVGFDYDSLLPYWKPVKDQKRRVSYFGRFATFKDPGRLIHMQPFLKEKNIITEMQGIERSMGALPLFYTDPYNKDSAKRKASYRENIVEVKDIDGEPEQTPEKVWIYGPYNRLEGLEGLSWSMFGADFYNLEASAYGDNFEYAMCEIIGVGSVPIFDKHWADNCTHVNGTRFSDLKGFAIYSDREDLASTAQEIEMVANDHQERERRRKQTFEWAKEHCDSDVVFRNMHEAALKVKKRKGTGKKETTKQLF